MSTAASLKKVEGRIGPHTRQRVAALAALVAETAGIIGLIVLVILRPVFAFALVVALAALLGCTFAALTFGGPRRWLATAGAVVVGIGIIEILYIWGEGAGLSPVVAPGALLLLGAGTLLGRYAMKRPPPRVVLDDIPDDIRLSRRSVLIINPRSGDGKAEQFDLEATAAELGVETIIMQEGDDLEELARGAVADGADVLGMAGGDGSQALVLSIAVEHDLPFVCIPSGTRNHFALDLGLDRNDPRHALAAFVDGEERLVDYGVVNGRTFVNNVALGVYAAIVDQDGYRDAKISTTLELLPTLIEKQGPWFDLQFDVPDHGHVDGTVLLMISNNPYAIGTSVNQRQSLAGGELGIIAVNPERLSDLMAITVLAAAGRPETAKALWSWSTPEFVVESGEPEIIAGIDGEKVALTPPLEFRIVPDAARVLVPTGTRIGLDEQSAGSWNYAGLVALAFNLNAADDGSDPVATPEGDHVTGPAGSARATGSAARGQLADGSSG